MTPLFLPGAEALPAVAKFLSLREKDLSFFRRSQMLLFFRPRFPLLTSSLCEIGSTLFFLK